MEGGPISALLGLGRGAAGLQANWGAHGVSTPSSSFSWASGRAQCLPQVGVQNFKTFWRGWDVAGNGNCLGQLVLLNGEGWSRADEGALEPCLPTQDTSRGPVEWAWVEGGRKASKA